MVEQRLKKLFLVLAWSLMLVSSAAWAADVPAGYDRGIRPDPEGTPTVVKVVRMIGRMRCVPAFTTHSLSGAPVRAFASMKSIMIRLSLTTTPERAMSPNNENMLIDMPITR